ncbi:MULTISPECIES: hypothetical protein [unclassified Burkholderia]|uniref:hypothetical protein n=1 Tax=unclassified Burkholderia TaxID=2613784 RepID=UPI0021AB3EE1|nr:MULTISPECIES: hypothetical protein [unclassified Burkholderia]
MKDRLRDYPANTDDYLTRSFLQCRTVTTDERIAVFGAFSRISPWQVGVCRSCAWRALHLASIRTCEPGDDWHRRIEMATRYTGKVLVVPDTMHVDRARPARYLD